MKKRIVVHIHVGHADTKDAKDGMRLVENIRDGSFYCKVYYDSDLEEYCCKLYHGGIYYSSADYFSDDKADALSTAKDMVRRLKAQFMKDEAPATLDSVSRAIKGKLSAS